MSRVVVDPTPSWSKVLIHLNLLLDVAGRTAEKHDTSDLQKIEIHAWSKAS
jgi:hypothetical protein